jgi:hypothetical protein
MSNAVSMSPSLFHMACFLVVIQLSISDRPVQDTDEGDPELKKITRSASSRAATQSSQTSAFRLSESFVASNRLGSIAFDCSKLYRETSELPISTIFLSGKALSQQWGYSEVYRVTNELSMSTVFVFGKGLTR